MQNKFQLYAKSFTNLYKNAVQGNSITRNILLEFSGAKALTGINVNANTWQIDFTVRLHGLDEKIRLTNRDLYGRAVFFDDSFLVKRKTGNQFTIQPGVAYVEGVRMDLTALYNLTANNLPCSVYADLVHHCTVTGEYQTEIKYLTQSKADYVDTANRQHYVQILADIDSQGNVTDRRLLSPFLGMNPLTLDDTTENTKDQRGHTHKLPIASLVKKGIVKLFSGYDSDAEDMAATPKAIKGLKALIDAITRNLGNYIPNSKKSSAVNSESEDNVATSKAAKIAYDKGIEAKTAADNAQHTANDGVSKADAAQRTANDGVSKANAAQTSANAANNNANGRISKTDISHATNGTNKDKVASEFAVGELARSFSYQKIGNFEVRKYPDGTMIQTYAVNVGEHQLTTGARKTFNWAVAFASKPMIWVTANATDNRNGAIVDLGALVGIVISDCTQAICAYHTNEIWRDTNHNPTMQFLAIGRWK